MNAKREIGILCLIALIIIGIVGIRMYNDSQPETIAPEIIEQNKIRQKEKVIKQLFPDEPKEASEVAGLKALKYFQEKDIVTDIISKDKVPAYRNFLLNWGYDWKVEFLKQEVNTDDLKAIWEGKLSINANTREQFEQTKKLLADRISKFDKSINITDESKETIYKSYAEVTDSYKNNELMQIDLNKARVDEHVYVHPDMGKLLEENINLALKNYSGDFTITNGAYSVSKQELLNKLGYPPFGKTYHLTGKAVDLKLSGSSQARFEKMLNEHNKLRFNRANSLYKSGTPLTIENMQKMGVLYDEHEITRAIASIQSMIKKEPYINIIDETPLWIKVDKNGNLESINPVLHIQIQQTVVPGKERYLKNKDKKDGGNTETDETDTEEKPSEEIKDDTQTGIEE